jgi:hypothetical protein
MKIKNIFKMELSKVNFHNTQFFRKNNTSVDFKYICIKKDFFDVKMINLNYKDLKKNKHIEIIYKSPSAFLEGLFFKTPRIKSNNISVIHKEKNYNNIILKLSLNHTEHSQFINILRQIDEHLSSSLYNNNKEIEDILYEDNKIIPEGISNVLPEGLPEGRIITQPYRYEQVIKFKNYSETIEMTMKSYLDMEMIKELEKKLPGVNYIFTFNISNIFLGNQSYMPLIKCNRCEKVS